MSHAERNRSYQEEDCIVIYTSLVRSNPAAPSYIIQTVLEIKYEVMGIEAIYLNWDIRTGAICEK